MEFRLHHIGVVVRDIERSAATYTQQLGYVARTGIIHDPLQTAYVRFLCLPGGTAYLELVSPDGSLSRLTNALNAGGGLNHLCYATDDIEGACGELRRQGMMVIHEPVPAVAFGGRRIAWLIGQDRVLTELVESAAAGDLHAL